jgi:hypothetical protein
MTERIEGVYSCTPMVNCATKRISLNTVNKILAFVLFACGIYYITTVNDLVVKGFVLQDLKSKAGVLREDNRSMNDRAVALKSCNDLSSRIQALGMVNADKIDYINVGKGTLASSR